MLRRTATKRRVATLAAGALIAVLVPAYGAADTFVDGTATGKTVPLEDGTFVVVGTFQDAVGVVGTYRGTYTELTTGYTSCRSTGIGAIFCGTAEFPNRCNLISGEVTLRSKGRHVTLVIGAAGLGPPASRVQSGVCLREEGTERDTFLMLTNRTDEWPATEEEFSHGYGILAWAMGSLVGTSSSRWNVVYEDDLVLDLGLFGDPPS